MFKSCLHKPSHIPAHPPPSATYTSLLTCKWARKTPESILTCLVNCMRFAADGLCMVLPEYNFTDNNASQTKQKPLKVQTSTSNFRKQLIQINNVVDMLSSWGERSALRLWNWMAFAVGYVWKCVEDLVWDLYLSTQNLIIGHGRTKSEQICTDDLKNCNGVAEHTWTILDVRLPFP